VPGPEPSPTTAPERLLPWTASARTTARLQAALNEMRADARIPGVSATIAFPDGTVWSGTSGLADVARGRPVSDDTAFSIASISKTFLAALALELSVEGTIGLDTPAATYLPELRLDPAITVRMLLNHTSGLADFFLNPRIDVALQSDRDRGWSAKRTLRYVQRPMFEPGEGWDYSNTNYLILGMLVERVTGRPLAEQFRERFFRPVGLTRTWDQMAEEPRGPVAYGYRLEGEGARVRARGVADGTRFIPFRSVITAARGAGSLAATSRDVALWGQALYGGTAISRESLRLMLARVRLNESSVLVPYGMGVQTVAVNGRPALGHSGRFLGFRAVMRYLRSEGVAVAVLTNQNRVDPAPIAARLLRIADPNRVRTGPPAQGRNGGATTKPSPPGPPGPVPSAP
jgi:D-alanyl-D-alanine carboxypeptidase